MRIQRIFFVFTAFLFFGISECTSSETIVRKNSLINKQTTIIYPSDYTINKYQKKRFKIDSEIVLNLYANNFSRGNAVYVEILPEGSIKIKKLKCSLDGKKIYLTQKKWGLGGFFAINPEFIKKEIFFSINYRSDSIEKNEKYLIKLRKKNFPVSRKALNLGTYSDAKNYLKPGILEFIKACSAKKIKALSRLSKDLISASAAHPRDMHFINSQFWKKRIYMRYEIKNSKKIKLKSRIKIHRGLDFKGEKGAPVYAMLTGKAVIAQKMYYEGNFIVLDHGNRIFSYYMHCDKLLVKEGQFVQAGTKIAEVGSTGASTGPHLHVSFVINKVHVDPLSILGLPIRN